MPSHTARNNQGLSRMTENLGAISQIIYIICMADRIRFHNLLKCHDVSSAFKKLAKRIEAGEIFIYPTETIYGIGGRADSQEVKRLIVKVKERKLSSPMILVAGRKEIFERFKIDFPKPARVLVKHFWPGRLTLVLPLRTGKGTVAIRVSNHPFITELYRYLTVPIFSTSANISGRPYVNSPDEIFSTFKSKIDFMIDAGSLPPSPSSTVVNILNDKKIELVREGVVKVNEIIKTFIKGYR